MTTIDLHLVIPSWIIVTASVLAAIYSVVAIVQSIVTSRLTLHRLRISHQSRGVDT